MGEGIKFLKDSYKLTPMNVKRFGDDILLETYYKKNYEKYFAGMMWA